MKRFALQRELLPRYAVALLAGLALAAAFPKFSVAGFAWVAPGILLFAAAGCAGGAAFRVGFVGGLAFNLAALHWLLFIPVRFFPVLGWLALSAYLALYPAVWAWLCWKMFPGKIPQRPGAFSTTLGVWAFTTFWQRLAWSLFCAAAWVALEMIMGRLLTGFPWLLLGVSQYQQITLIPIAAFTGPYGLSFAAVWFAVSLVFAGVITISPPYDHRAARCEIALPLLFVAGLMWFGFEGARSSKERGIKSRLKITLVQPSIPQTMIWDARESTNRFQKLLQLSEAALADKPDLLVWPEAGVPNLLRYDEHVLGAVTNLARAHGVWMVVGAEDAEPGRDADGKGAPTFFNSSFLITPEGRLLEKYDKRRLVIFGEYIPFARWLPFLKWFTPIEGGFTPGGKAASFALQIPRLNSAVRISPIICFEDAFPHGARDHAGDGTDFLLNLTNDGWFGEGAQQWQHAANAAFRAVENARPLVRCCNNGITGWVDEHGRQREIFRDRTGSAHGAGHLTISIPLPPGGGGRTPTFYHRHGDLFGWSCVAVVAATSLWSFFRRR
ncbi:MAG: apolipoprotein N-acyltransferase [Verrucomicrobia bacterium]|nr:apolipoprotein N-acyltransferase [Verrucomicrobiota bacterium]